MKTLRLRLTDLRERANAPRTSEKKTKRNIKKRNKKTKIEISARRPIK